MTDEEVQACVKRAEEEYEMLKDRCHELYEKLEKSGIATYIKKEDLNTWVAKYFTNDLISINDLIGCIEDLADKVEHLEEEKEELEESIKDNYIPKDRASRWGDED